MASLNLVVRDERSLRREALFVALSLGLSLVITTLGCITWTMV